MPTSPSTRFRAGLAVAACGAIGAGIGIAGAAAAPGAKSKSKSTSRSATQGATSGQPAPPAPPRPPYGGGSPPVHEQAVVLDRAGKSFITVTTDDGTVDSVAGDQLTVTESAGKVTYQKLTLTIPSGATVIREGKKATLSQVKSGDHVLVRQSSDGTFVLAGDG